MSNTTIDYYRQSSLLEMRKKRKEIMIKSLIKLMTLKYSLIMKFISRQSSVLSESPDAIRLLAISSGLSSTLYTLSTMKIGRK